MMEGIYWFDNIRSRLVQHLSDALAEPWPDYTERRLWGSVEFAGKATAVVGIRRSGKTTFLHQVRQNRYKQGVARERLPYINFEDERLVGMKAEHLSILIEEYYRRFPDYRGRETVTWCFDEIQVVPGWEKFIRRLLDSEKVEIFISGSSAALLSREIATSLRGRAWEVVIFPFSFEEYLRYHGVPLPRRPDLVTSRERSMLENALKDYLTTGGFPEAQDIDKATRYQLLSDYVDVAILRDVVERHNVSNVTGLRWLIRHLLGNPGAMFSVEKFYAALKSQGFAIGRDTLHNLLSYLEDCFIVRLTWMEAESERQRMVNPRKSYPIDSGLIPIFDRSARAIIGHALETAVRIELERRLMEVSYVRTHDGFEVDFLARSADGHEELIQVCSDLSERSTLQREIRALLSAAEEHPHAKLRVITMAPESALGIPDRIQVDSAALWFIKPWIDDTKR